MNTVREIERLNKRELENVVPPSASWHTDYRSTAFVHISGLAYTLTEGDILTIFSQFGTPTYLHLARDKDSGKSKGFGWLKYEDQRSTDLAVDNLGGATVVGRTLKVDHATYKRKEGDEEQGRDVDVDVDSGERSDDTGDEGGEERPLLKEEMELRRLIEEHDDDDPMKRYLVEEKREEVQKAVRKFEKRRDKESGEGKHRHRHRHHHRRRDEDGGRGYKIEDGRGREDGRRKSGRRSASESEDRERRERRHHRRRSLSRSP